MLSYFTEMLSYVTEIHISDMTYPFAQVVATDGLWEVMKVEEVAQFVNAWRRRPWPGWNCADALTLEAQERWKLLQPEVRTQGWGI